MNFQQSVTTCMRKYATFGRRASRIDFAKRFTLWLLVAVLLHGCASMSEAECLNADWTVVGEIDGGYPASALGYGIHTQGDSLEEIRRNVREAFDCYFDETMERPNIIRLHFVRGEKMGHPTKNPSGDCSIPVIPE